MKIVPRPGEAAVGRLLRQYERASVTYPEVGASAGPVLPVGYHHVRRQIRLPSDPECFARASDALMAWRMHWRAGLVVASSSPRATVDGTVVMALRAGPIGVVIPCRVVWTLDEPDRRGFAYGTLSGHPERGEEAFVVERHGHEVMFSIRAFSVAGDPLVRAAGPLARGVQAWMTSRYLRSLQLLGGRSPDAP